MKILALLLCVFLLVGTASASMEGCHFAPNVPSPSGGAIYEKGILTIPIDSIQKPETQEAIRAWQYEDIEIL